MEHVGTIRLSGAPLPGTGCGIHALTEQPYQTETDEDAHQRLGDEEIQSHEERGISREEMPYPGHEFCRIGWRICPCATSAVSLTGMVHNHQNGKAYLQIIEIIQSFHIS